jgi:hypothetical protein
MASVFLSSVLGVLVFSAPEQILPITDGTAWRYKMTEQAGSDLGLSDDGQHQAGTLHLDVVYRINGTREIDGKDLLEFEMHRAGRVINTDLMTVDDHGVQCWARVDETGKLIRLDPPLAIVASPLDVGTTWDFDGNSEAGKIHQHYKVVDQEKISVPAGEYHAFHIRGEQSTPGPMSIDRWFVPGVGIVKDVTETRSASGQLLRRTSLELAASPKVEARPKVKTRPATNKLTVSLGQDAVGESRSTFVSVAPKIYARWQGNGLHAHARIRARWVAEEVEGVAPPEYTIDEATALATAPDSHGIFTLGAPEGGWAPGKYRVDFYLNDQFEETARLRITESAAAARPSKFGPDTGLSSDGLPEVIASPKPSRAPSP